MSAIQKELAAATDTPIKKGEDRQEYLKRLIVAVHKLDDKAWNALSNEASDWFNAAADEQNAKKKVLSDFPDLAADEPEEKAPSRRRKSADAEERLTKVGDTVSVLSKRGKTTVGEVIELDDEIIVLKVGDEELEFDMSKVESVTVNHGSAGEPEDDTLPAGPAVGDVVMLTTKRGKTVTGEVIELSDDEIVLKVGDEELEYDIAKVESVVVQGGKAEPEAAEEKPKGRARAAKEDAPAEKEKPTRSSNPAGVSVGARIRELVGANPDVTVEEVDKQLKKEGIEFRDTSLKMIFKDCTQLLAELRKSKKLK